MIFSHNLVLLLIACFISNYNYSQVKFHINEFNYFTIHDSIKGVTYSFDSGSEHSNLFDRGKIGHKFGGISFIRNAVGKIRFIKKGRIREEFPGLGEVRTNANILAGKGFSEDHCISFDLLFGAKVMKRHKLHFDNKHNIMTSLDALPPDIAGYNRLELKHGFFYHDYYLMLKINGKEERFLVDTGYSGQITMASDEGLPIATDTYSYLDLNAFTVAETTLAQHAKTLVQHKDSTFKNDVAYSFAAGGMNIIGNAFFLNFEDVIFDLKGKCIYVRNERDRFDPFPDDILFGANKKNDLRIIYIKNSSSYYEKGFRVGDTVMLQDRELQQQLLDSPCETVAILRRWRSAHDEPLLFSKG